MANNRGMKMIMIPNTTMMIAVKMQGQINHLMMNQSQENIIIQIRSTSQVSTDH
jgi:hypothetical protein